MGGNVRISIRGKGSNSKAGRGEEAVPGMPEEPLRVLLEGTKEGVERAERLVREFLEDSEAADGEKARQLGSILGGGLDVGGRRCGARGRIRHEAKLSLL